MNILFLHGWHSVPGGVKPTYLKDHGHEVINPALDDDDFDAAVRTAQTEFDKHQPQIVVGSSRGGAVAVNINSGDAKLVLLCPAWKNWGTAKTVKPSTVILHSRADDVIPFADSEELARNSGAKLIESGSDHRLADPEPLAAMLRACEERAMPSNDSYSQFVLADGPVGYWRLNEQSLTEQVTDESGHNHHGSFVGIPSLGEQGAIHGNPNCSMSFAPEAHIEIPHSTEFSIPTSGDGLSVEVWMRPDNLLFQGEDDKRYIHWLGKGVARKMEWGFRLYSSDHSKRPKRISAYAWNPQGGEGAGAYYQGISVQESLVQEGAWLHLVACFEHYVDPCVRKTGVQLFINGKFVQGPPSSGTLYFNEGHWSVLPQSNDAPLRIATRSATANSFLTGGIDEVAIYPKVLTPHQIRGHYEAGIGA